MRLQTLVIQFAEESPFHRRSSSSQSMPTTGRSEPEQQAGHLREAWLKAEQEHTRETALVPVKSAHLASDRDA
jgi:hypothetical protein